MLDVAPYLERRVKRSPRTGALTVYYYWVPRKRDRARFGVKIERLAKSVPADAPEAERLARAVEEAKRHNARLRNLRDGSKARPAATIRGTIPWLVEEFKKSPRFAQLDDYEAAQQAQGEGRKPTAP